MINVIAFGQIAAITGSQFQLSDVADTSLLLQELHKLFPELLNKKFAIAVNKQMISQPTPIAENATVALLPPFSGG